MLKITYLSGEIFRIFRPSRLPWRKHWIWIRTARCSRIKWNVLHYWDNWHTNGPCDASPPPIWTKRESRRTSAAIEVQTLDCQFRQSSPLIHPRSVFLSLQHPSIQCLLIMCTEDSAPSSPGPRRRCSAAGGAVASDQSLPLLSQWNICNNWIIYFINMRMVCNLEHRSQY